jgi:hypothetical protein
MTAKPDLEELEATVQRMRQLGVTEWNGIKLGPVPAPPSRAPTPEEVAERAARREEKRRDVLFGASSLKPALPSRRKKS